MNPQPRRHGFLPVGDGQQIYWEEWGAPNGVPALYLHGGPGGGLGASGYRNRFDLNRTRVIAFEQRGCGRSTPHAWQVPGNLEHQLTSSLVEDIERLRLHLGVQSWIVNGVSWGTTLALSYAVAHPQRVSALVLFAVTTTSRSEVDWITEGVGSIFPEAWDHFSCFARQHCAEYRAGQLSLVQAYAQLLNSPDPKLCDEASAQWALWEDTHVSLAAGDIIRDPRWEDARFRLAFARLTTHYWANAGFNDPPLVDQIGRIAQIPGVLIHGRNDISSPARTAWHLHKLWPASELIIQSDDGHGGASMVEQWSAANLRLLNKLIASQL